MTWLRSRPRWQLVAMALVLGLTAWSILEALPNGRVPYLSGHSVGAGGPSFSKGWKEPSGTIHLEYQSTSGANGVIIDGMDAAGTRGTVTVFTAGARAYANLADCDASFQETTLRDIEGSITCATATRAPDDGRQHTIGLTFVASH